MALPLTDNYRKKLLYRVVFNDAEAIHLRIAQPSHAAKLKAIRPPKKHSTGQIIAMYAFSIFELDKDRIAEAPSFPHHFICGHLLPEEQNRVNDAVKLFHLIKEQYKPARQGKIIVNSVSEYRSEFNNVESEVLAVSKIYRGERMVFIYNASTTEAKERFIKLDNFANPQACQLIALYGYESCSRVNINRATVNAENIAYLKLYLKPQHLVILALP